jgi:hypothetical protein
MKLKLSIITLFLFVHILQARTNIYTHTRYDNVDLYISTINHNEKIYFACIIGQYVQILSKKLNYNNKIEISFFEKVDTQTNIVASNILDEKNGKKILRINIQRLNFDIAKTLNIINYLLQDINDGKADLVKLYEVEPTIEINELLKIRIDRPNFLPELEKQRVKYYFQYNKFHFYYISLLGKNEIKIIDYDKLENYYSISHDLLFIFIDPFTIQTINLRDEKVNDIVYLDMHEYYELLNFELINYDKILFKIKKKSQEEILMIYFFNKNFIITNIDEFVIDCNRN